MPPPPPCVVTVTIFNHDLALLYVPHALVYNYSTSIAYLLENWNKLPNYFEQIWNQAGVRYRFEDIDYDKYTVNPE